jgi:Protein of unknown function (DUF2931)
VKFILLLSNIILFLSCKNKEDGKIVWYSAMSRPHCYVTGGPKIFYYNKGKIIGSSATLTDISGCWGSPSAAVNSGKIEVLPDSVAVNYGGLNTKLQMCSYEGGSRLPEQKIRTLFENGYYKKKKKENFQDIITGLAPGGRICVWVDHIEICRFSVQEFDVWLDRPSIMFDDSTRVMDYLKYHPVDYSIWEKTDPRYELDFGFCSQNGEYRFRQANIYSIEGNSSIVRGIDDTEWGVPYGKKATFIGSRSYQTYSERKVRDQKLHLPVHMFFQWAKNTTAYYNAEFVMPKDFKQRFLKPYINKQTGKTAQYNRIVLGVQNDGLHCNMWLDGPGKQEKIMSFKGMPERKQEGFSNYYATEVVYY